MKYIKANLLGVAVSCSGFLVMFLTFMMVYFGKWDSIDINAYGEAKFEFVLLLTLLPFVIYATWWHVKIVMIKVMEENRG